MKSIVEPQDGLLQHALDAVHSDNEVCMEHFATHERDPRTSRNSKIGLNVTNEGTEANTYAGYGAREVMGHRLVVPMMDVVVRRAMIVGHV